MSSRRRFLKGAAGVGSSVLLGLSLDLTAEAARRGYSGPTLTGATGGGYRFEFVASADGVVVVALTGTSGSPFDVTFSNRTSIELEVRVLFHSQIMHSLRMTPNSTSIVQLSNVGMHQFTVARIDGQLLRAWEARIPASS